MIKVVIFDVGGVLIRTVDPQPRKALEISLNLAPGQAEYLVFNSESGRAAQLGQITAAEHWQWVRAHLHLENHEALIAFQEQFFGGDRLDTDLIDFIRRLRSAYRTAIISNYMDDLPHLLHEVHAVTDAFELIVVSSIEMIMKPDAAIFERTLARLGVLPAEAVFIDDFAHNVEGARAVGMHAIHYTPGLELQTELAQFGVEPLGTDDAIVLQKYSCAQSWQTENRGLSCLYCAQRFERFPLRITDAGDASDVHAFVGNLRMKDMNTFACIYIPQSRSADASNIVWKQFDLQKTTTMVRA